ncbi:MAG: hypothetical protein IT371_15765 [Deltaproteobacteria bacterium]|nr:hypothetical protein [Deltaproteobacteria bacterium]
MSSFRGRRCSAGLSVLLALAGGCTGEIDAPSEGVREATATTVKPAVYGPIASAEVTVATLGTTPVRDPAVAWNGQSFTLVWESGGEIHGARVSSTGQLLDPSPIPIAVGAGVRSSPVIACSAAQCLVVWNQARPLSGFGSIYAARLSLGGAVLDTTPLEVLTGGLWASSRAVASGNGDFLVGGAFALYSQAMAVVVRVSAQGQVGSYEPVGASGLTAVTAMGFDGTSYQVLVWDAMGNRKSVRLVPPVGAVGSEVTLGQHCPESAADTMSCAPGVCTLGMNHFVSGGYVFKLVRVDQTGTVLDPSGIAISKAARLTFDGSRYLLAWNDPRNAGTTGVDLYGAYRTASLGAVGLEAPLSTVPGDENLGGLTSDGLGTSATAYRRAGNVLLRVVKFGRRRKHEPLPVIEEPSLPLDPTM